MSKSEEQAMFDTILNALQSAGLDCYESGDGDIRVYMHDNACVKLSFDVEECAD